MDFAKKQLEKYGWRDGNGLGKNEDGISKAIKPKLKFDNAGVGYQMGDQFVNNWWERIFNKAANNINVRMENDEVKLHLSSDPVEISTKDYLASDFKKNKNLEYRTFIKTAKTSEDGFEPCNFSASHAIAPFHSLTDEELFSACGGRTAHKGARHGLKLSGKLQRLEKQEKLLLKKMKNVSLTDDTSNLEKKMKKLKKHKEKTSIKSVQETEISSGTGSKKIKNKRKSVTFNEETVVKYYTPDLDTSRESIRDENSNNNNNNNNNSGAIDSNVCDEGIEQDIEDNNSEFSDSHRSFEEAQRPFDDLSKAERKKLKKKRKLDKKKTATALFIEEVREQMCSDDNCKKRKLVIDEMDAERRQSSIFKYSKKKKYVPEKIKKDKLDKKMKSIVESLDTYCRISDDE